MSEVEFAALIGIDWGDRAHHVVVWNVDQRATTEVAVEQTPEAVHPTLHEHARLSIGQSAWARAYYEQIHEQGVERQTIFGSLAYRWIRIMFACWKSRQPYDENRYIEQLRQRGSPLVEKIAA